MTPSPTSGRKSAPPQNGSTHPRGSSKLRQSLLGIDEVAGWLGVEVGFVRRLVAERRIPFVKIGKYVRFDPDDVMAWIDQQRIGIERPTRGRNFRDFP